jgi:2,3,4,5-tetrahydropyridine-2,6-dicarboxylate N-succinyltransferase
LENLKQVIESVWDDRSLLKEAEVQQAIRSVIELLDKGQLRVAHQESDQWIVNEWVKKAVILYFPIQQMETIEVGPFEWHDKIALKKSYAAQGVRAVPHAIARYGSFPRKWSHHDAILCQYRCLCWFRDDGGHLGDCWLMCTDRAQCSSQRRSWDRRRLGAGASQSRSLLKMMHLLAQDVY